MLFLVNLQWQVLGIMNSYLILFTLATCGSTLLGGLTVIKFRARLPMVSAFAAGVLIAVPLFDLLPESIRLGNQVLVPVEHIMYSTALGFISLLFLERYISVHRVCDQDSCRNVRHPKGGMFGAAELCLHSFMDGFAIGLSFHFDYHVGMIVAVAVISHDFSDGINTVTVMLNSGNSARSSFLLLLADAIAPLIGAFSTLLISIPGRYLILMLPFFAGGFLYLGAGDLLPEVHEKNPPLPSFLFCLAGFILIFIVTRFLRI
jgi:zinc transporter ZupT